MLYKSDVNIIIRGKGSGKGAGDGMGEAGE
jgi:hypothetical protein